MAVVWYYVVEEGEEMNCTCEEWEKGIKEIDGYIDFATLHGFKDWRDNPKFKFCPWCGKRLRKEKK